MLNIEHVGHEGFHNQDAVAVILRRYKPAGGKKERQGHRTEVNVFIKYITFFFFLLTIHLNYKSVHTNE